MREQETKQAPLSLDDVLNLKVGDTLFLIVEKDNIYYNKPCVVEDFKIEIPSIKDISANELHKLDEPLRNFINSPPVLITTKCKDVGYDMMRSRTNYSKSPPE